jgi:hypothetical protein
MWKTLAAGVFALTAVALNAAPAQAQIYGPPARPKYPPQVYYPPGPGQTPLQQGYLPPPTSYSFNGPSAGTYGYYATTTYYYAGTPCGDRLVPTTTIQLQGGYQPGYYSGYYSPLYYRP